MLAPSHAPLTLRAFRGPLSASRGYSRRSLAMPYIKTKTKAETKTSRRHFWAHAKRHPPLPGIFDGTDGPVRWNVVTPVSLNTPADSIGRRDDGDGSGLDSRTHPPAGLFPHPPAALGSSSVVDTVAAPGDACCRIPWVGVMPGGARGGYAGGGYTGGGPAGSALAPPLPRVAMTIPAAPAMSRKSGQSARRSASSRRQAKRTGRSSGQWAA